MQNNKLITAFLIGLSIGVGYVAVDSMASLTDTMARIDAKNRLDAAGITNQNNAASNDNYSFPAIEYIDTNGEDLETIIGH